jgi:hypothetical protein
VIEAGNLLVALGQTGGSDFLGIAEAANKVLVGVGFGIRMGATIADAFIQAGINVSSLYAAQARREQEWNYQKALATQDIKIGEIQVKTAQDQVRVSEQDRAIADIQASNAQATIDFLNNKFTNAELYNWMSGVLAGVFNYYVQAASNYALLAQNQLAFERQQPPQAIVQNDYWDLPSAASSLSGGNGPDRRGLTSATRLLMDITKLEDYATGSEVRKLQITKDFSLAAYFPMEFQQFKETGQMVFDTLPDYFDRDYPGHYLRLIKQVSVTIIALAPPTQGIKATLTSSGVSRVVIGGTVFQDVTIRRDPESIALSGNRASNGAFELQPMDGNTMNPFEGSGVYTRWQLIMEKAANFFDFATIADVIVRIDYTALNSADYAKQVKMQLGGAFASERAFSFRSEFADAFYQWTHLEQFDYNTEVSVKISALDFPANVSKIGVKSLKFYIPTVPDFDNPQYNLFAPSLPPKEIEVTLQRQAGTPVSGKAGFSPSGIVSTETNGGSLVNLATPSANVPNTPFGTWTINLKGLTEALDGGRIADVIMVIGYEGNTPPWIS